LDCKLCIILGTNPNWSSCFWN